MKRWRSVNTYRVTRTAWVLGVAALGACGGVAPLELTNTALENQRARWQASGIRDYQYEYRQQCECVPALLEPALIEVRRGMVTRVVYQKTGQPASPDAQALFPTIDELFDRIDDAIRSDAAMLIVSYDSALGYPTQIDIDYDLQVVDDEVSIDAAALAAL